MYASNVFECTTFQWPYINLRLNFLFIFSLSFCLLCFWAGLLVGVVVCRCSSHVYSLCLIVKPLRPWRGLLKSHFNYFPDFHSHGVPHGSESSRVKKRKRCSDHVPGADLDVRSARPHLETDASTHRTSIWELMRANNQPASVVDARVRRWKVEEATAQELVMTMLSIGCTL